MTSDDSAPLWTVAEACEYFAASGVPMAEWRLRLMIRATGLQPVKWGPSGEKGGRGKGLYDASALQRIHGRMLPLIASGPDPGGSRLRSQVLAEDDRFA